MCLSFLLLNRPPAQKAVFCQAIDQILLGPTFADLTVTVNGRAAFAEYKDVYACGVHESLSCAVLCPINIKGD